MPLDAFGSNGGSYTSVLQLAGGLLPISIRRIRPGTLELAHHTEPSVGFTMMPYGKPATRMSLLGSVGRPGCVYSPILPSPLVSTIIGHQPWVVVVSCVLSQAVVLIHPMTLTSPEK